MSTPLRTLVADGTRRIREILTQLLVKLGHEVVSVGNGQDAYDRLLLEPFDILITDLNMPGMDGLELCWSVKRQMEDTYIIVITSDNTVARYSEAIDAGADEFLSKDIKGSILMARIRSAERIVNYRKELQEQKRTIQEQYNKLDQAMVLIRKDLDAAARMQRGMTPHAPLINDHSHLDHIFEPATFIGGDLLSYFPLTDHHVGFYVLDVAGHGVPSALLAASLGHMMVPGFLMADHHPRSPADVVTRLNQRLLSESDLTMHFTMVYGVYDGETGTVVFCQAGHPPGVLVRRDGGAHLVGDGGFPIGLVDDATWENICLTLQPGDRLFLYSDGLSEGLNSRGEMFDEPRVARVLEGASGCGLKENLLALRQALRAWTASDTLDDDLSIIALECVGPLKRLGRGADGE